MRKPCSRRWVLRRRPKKTSNSLTIKPSSIKSVSIGQIEQPCLRAWSIRGGLDLLVILQALCKTPQDLVSTLLCQWEDLVLQDLTWRCHKLQKLLSIFKEPCCRMDSHNPFSRPLKELILIDQVGMLVPKTQISTRSSSNNKCYSQRLSLRLGRMCWDQNYLIKSSGRLVPLILKLLGEKVT